MSLTSPIPMLDDLPLEIEGVQVRESIRDVFSKSVNGTLNNISKEGCLALALKSNEVGCGDKGYVTWNAWRKHFPVRLNSVNFNFENKTDFAEVDFREMSINFSQFEFGDVANFQGSKWGVCANFQCAKWGGMANFRGAHWGNQANFQGAQWGRLLLREWMQLGSWDAFQDASWGEGGDFEGAHWGDWANFRGAQWSRGANFRGAQWGDWACFRGSQWGEKANFQHAQLGVQADFSAATWQALRDVYPDQSSYDLAQLWACERDLSPDALEEISFQCARFLGRVVFNNRCFRSSTNFSHAINRQTIVRNELGQALFDEGGDFLREVDSDQRQFVEAPHFHGCELHQDTSFEDAKFPTPSGSEENARAYRTLKLAFSKQQAIREEQRFFRLEMEEETLSEKGFKSWLFKQYKRFGGYGFSIERPFVYGVSGVLVFTALYGILSWLGQCGFNEEACHFAPQWLEFSLLQTLPLPGLEKLSETSKKVFWPVGAWWDLVLLALVIMHKTISLLALFLIGLALRNLFKLK